jgi:hypothetical protein
MEAIASHRIPVSPSWKAPMTWANKHTTTTSSNPAVQRPRHADVRLHQEATAFGGADRDK